MPAADCNRLADFELHAILLASSPRTTIAPNAFQLRSLPIKVVVICFQVLEL